MRRTNLPSLLSGALALAAVAAPVLFLSAWADETGAKATQAAGQTETSAKPAELETGMKAPDFNLPDQDGKLHHLADLHGKTVLLAFYPKDLTAG